MRVWVGAIITAILTSLAVLSSIRVQRKAAALQVATELGAEYRVHWVIVLLAWIEILMSVWILLQSRTDEPGIDYFYLVIGIPLVALGIAGLCYCRRAKVAFSGQDLIFCDGFRTHTYNLNEVQSVWVVNGMITVDFGRIPRLVIMHVFSNSAEILARLEHAAQDNRMRR
jgi:hypothetical protein